MIGVVIYLQLVAFVAIAATALETHWRIKKMTDEEKKAFEALAQKIESLATVAENFRNDNHALKAENEALKAQLAAVPPPVVTDDADELAEIAKDVAVLDAELAKV